MERYQTVLPFPYLNIIFTLEVTLLYIYIYLYSLKPLWLYRYRVTLGVTISIQYSSRSPKISKKDIWLAKHEYVHL